MKSIIGIVLFSLCMSCQGSSSTDKAGPAAPADSTRPVRLITPDPGHFHAALVQKSMYADIDPVVHVYAPDGTDLKAHLERIGPYNSRQQSPTHWNEKVYTGADFFQRMISEKAGNTVVLSGNNLKKMIYIASSLEAGFNVLADKPMAIDSKDFPLLEKAFSTAAGKNLRLYDIMTERFEITSMLQREFSMHPEIFGAQLKGTPDNPGIVKSSVHHFYKYVSGKVLSGHGPLMKDTILQVYCNGEINYRLRGVHIRTTATWTYKDPATADDTYYSLMRGARADLVIRQGAEENYKPALHIEPVHNSASYQDTLDQLLKSMQTKYPGIGLKASRKGWQLTIPEQYKEGHEAHFARVTQNFLSYLKNNNMPAWEVPNMIAKYYTTTKALEMAKHKK